MAKNHVEFTGDDGDIRRSFARMIRDELRMAGELRKLREQSKRTEQQFKRMGRSGQDAFGTKILDTFKSKLVGAGGVATAIATVTKALREMDQVREEAAQKLRFSEMGLGALSQLSGGDPAKLRGLITAAKATYAEGGAKDLNQAARTVFSLESAGALESRALFSRLYPTVENPDLLARASVTMLTSMGQKETGSVRDIISKGFGASAYAPSTVPELLEATARTGAWAKMLGWSDEALLAATTLQSKITGTAPEAATQIRSFAGSLAEKGEFEGVPLDEAVRAISAKGMSNAELKEYFGRKEALAGFVGLRDNMKLFNEIKAKVYQAQEDDLTGAIIAAREVQPDIMAARKLRMAEAKLELERIPTGQQRALTDAMLKRRRQEAEAAGDEVGAMIRDWGTSAYRFVAGDTLTMKRLGTPEEQRTYREVQRGVITTPQERRAQIERGNAAFKRPIVDENGNILRENIVQNLADRGLRLPRLARLARRGGGEELMYPENINPLAAREYLEAARYKATQPSAWGGFGNQELGTVLGQMLQVIRQAQNQPGGPYATGEGLPAAVDRMARASEKMEAAAEKLSQAAQRPVPTMGRPNEEP